MDKMFYDTKSFNQPLNKWNVRNVKNMISMFEKAASFNQDISNWCVTNIITEPLDFSSYSPLKVENKPKWSTCP
jgi:surface protein